MRELDRRTALKGIGITASLVGFSGLATARDEGDEEYDEPEFGDWLEDVDETVDETGEDEVEIVVGAGDDGRQFDPASVRISEGTTVVWEWTDQGGSHDVTHDPDAEDEELEDDEDEDDDELESEFESELVEEEGHTFEHEFEDEGTYLYVCTAHEPDGMRGAIVVEEENGDGDEDEDGDGDGENGSGSGNGNGDDD